MPNNHLELHYIVYKWKYKKLFSIICTVFRNKLSWSLFLQAARMSLHKYGLGFLQLSINNKWIELILFWYENDDDGGTQSKSNNFVTSLLWAVVPSPFGHWQSTAKSFSSLLNLPQHYKLCDAKSLNYNRWLVYSKKELLQ